jgi:hypothetical protein
MHFHLFGYCINVHRVPSNDETQAELDTLVAQGLIVRDPDGTYWPAPEKEEG